MSYLVLGAVTSFSISHTSYPGIPEKPVTKHTFKAFDGFARHSEKPVAKPTTKDFDIFARHSLLTTAENPVSNADDTPTRNPLLPTSEKPVDDFARHSVLATAETPVSNADDTPTRNPVPPTVDSFQQIPDEAIDAIRSFIETNQQISGVTQTSKEAKDKRAEAKKMIVDVMQTHNRTFFQVENVYLLLKKILKKPPVNNEFLSKAYVAFNESLQNQNQYHGLSPEQVRDKFSEYVFFQQKKMGVITHDIAVSKKKPMCATVFESFSN